MEYNFMMRMWEIFTYIFVWVNQKLALSPMIDTTIYPRALPLMKLLLQTHKYTPDTKVM